MCGLARLFQIFPLVKRNLFSQGRFLFNGDSFSKKHGTLQKQLFLKVLQVWKHSFPPAAGIVQARNMQHSLFKSGINSCASALFYAGIANLAPGVLNKVCRRQYRWSVPVATFCFNNRLRQQRHANLEARMKGSRIDEFRNKCVG